LRIYLSIFRFMIKRIISFWIILVLLKVFLGSTALSEVDSESVDNKEVLNLTNCINVALKNAPTILRAKKELEPARLSLIDSRAAFAPSLDLNADYGITEKQYDPQWNKDYYDATLSLSQTLYDSGTRFRKARKARLNWLKELQRYSKVKNDLIFEVTKSYLDVLRAQSMVRTEQEFYQQAKFLLELAESKHRLGYVPESDVKKGKVEVASAEVSLIDAENDVEISQAELNSILGLDITQPIEIEDISEPVEIKGRPAELLEEARNNRLSIKIMQRSIQIDKVDVSLAARELWPHLKLSGEISLPLEEEYPIQERDWQAGLKLTYPLFDAGTNYRKYKNAKIQLSQRQNDFEDLKQDIDLEVTRAYLELMRQKKVRKVAKLRASLAQDSFNDSQNRYDLGLAPIREVTNARVAYMDAKIREARVYYDFLLAQARLEKALGRSKYGEEPEE